MSDLQTFVYSNMYAVRTMILNGEPWFVAKDVCDALELGNVSMALSRLDEDERNTINLNDGTPGNPYMAVINEPGLYSLILGSRKPEAREFKRWVTHDVIPSIRRTGTYSVQQPQTIEDLIIMQAQALKDIRLQSTEAKQLAERANHRIDSLDRIDINGDSQQRLNKMIQRYAHQEGLTFPKAWREFTDRFNTAYRTNLTARIENYKEKHGLKELTRPQYLSIAEQLEDAIRVADKMLNQPVEV